MNKYKYKKDDGFFLSLEMAQTSDPPPVGFGK